MKALVLAGGKGQRLRPYTTVIPKPLMPLGNRPVLEILIRQLKAHGITEIVLAVNHLRELIEAFFRDGSQLGLKISYATEDRPLGTAGPIANVLDAMSENFLVLNGDLLTTLNFRNLASTHLQHGAAATIATYQRDHRIDFGIVQSDASGALTGYIEKPTYHYDVSMGCYVLSREAVRAHCRIGVYLDMPDLMRAMVAANQVVRCHRDECYWLDIGRPEDYQLANEIIDGQPEKFLYFEAR